MVSTHCTAENGQDVIGGRNWQQSGRSRQHLDVVSNRKHKLSFYQYDDRGKHGVQVLLRCNFCALLRCHWRTFDILRHHHHHWQERWSWCSTHIDKAKPQLHPIQGLAWTCQIQLAQRRAAFHSETPRTIAKKGF